MNHYIVSEKSYINIHTSFDTDKSTISPKNVSKKISLKFLQNCRISQKKEAKTRPRTNFVQFDKHNFLMGNFSEFYKSDARHFVSWGNKVNKIHYLNIDV